MTVVTRFPTTNAVYVGGLTSPNNAHADDGVYATAAPGKNADLGTKYGNFGFDSCVPAGASITKVEILYQYKTSTTASVATSRTLARISGVDQATHDDGTEPAADTTITVDVTADRSWTRANLLDGTLEAILDARRGNSNTAVTFSYDFIQVRVTYTIASAQGSFTESGQAATLKRGLLLTSAQGSYAETGQTAILSHGYPLTAAKGNFTETGIAAAITKTWLPFTASRGTIGINGQSTNLVHAFNLMVAGAGILADSGQAASLIYSRLPLTAARGTLVLTGEALNLLWDKIAALETGIFTLDGYNVTLLYTQGGGIKNYDSVNKMIGLVSM